MIPSSDSRPSWLRQAVQQAAARNQAETLALIGLIVFVAIIIGALYLAQSTSTAITGRQLEQLVKTRDSFQRDNEDLVAQIAAQKDINQLRQRAAKLGFATITANNQEYVVIGGYQVIRATPTPVVTPVPTFVYEETFNGWFQQQWDRFNQQFAEWAARTGTNR
jgi:hypothetical protein